MSHMRSEAPKSPKEGRKFERVKVRGVGPWEAVVLVGGGSVRERPLVGQAEPQ